MSFQSDLAALLRSVQPRLVVTSSELDRHGDHIGLSLFVWEAVKAWQSLGLAHRPSVWESLIHSQDGDLNWPKDGPFFTQPISLPDEAWRCRVELQGVDAERKRLLLEQYQSAFYLDEPEVHRYLLSFAKENEWFLPR